MCGYANDRGVHAYNSDGSGGIRTDPALARGGKATDADFFFSETY